MATVKGTGRLRLRLGLGLGKGHTAETLQNEYPTLPPELIDEVIGFYVQNKAEVDAYVAEVAAKIQQFRAGYQPGPGILRIRARPRKTMTYRAWCREPRA